MKRIAAAVCAAVLVLAGCSKKHEGQQATASSHAASQPAAPAPQPARPSSSGEGETIAMTATRDLALQQCPGSSCMARGIIPKSHSVKVDPFGIRIVKDPDGTEHSWVKIAYEGDLCWVGSDCSSTTPTSHPIDGWVDYKLLATGK